MGGRVQRVAWQQGLSGREPCPLVVLTAGLSGRLSWPAVPGDAAQPHCALLLGQLRPRLSGCRESGPSRPGLDRPEGGRRGELAALIPEPRTTTARSCPSPASASSLRETELP